MKERERANFFLSVKDEREKERKLRKKEVKVKKKEEEKVSFSLFLPVIDIQS